MKKIKIYFLDRKISLSDRRKLKLFIEELFIKEKKSLKSLVYVFCSDEYLIKINKEFLKHDVYTDILTFELGYPGKETEGDIYISLDRVNDNSKRLGLSVKEELHRVIFHGALHLCGYKDKKKSEIKRMRKKEEEYLNKFFK